MIVVADASTIASALIATDETGRWAEGIIGAEQLLAPHHVFAETASVIRRAWLSGEVTNESASGAHADLLELPFTLCDYESFAGRIWELRTSVTVYDAWYVAIAEEFDVPLATLDLRLSRAPGPRCLFLTPPRSPIASA